MQPTSGAAMVILKPIMTLEGPVPGDYYHISISYFPDGQRMISGASDKTVRQWHLQTRKEIENAPDVDEHEVYLVAVSRDGRWVITVEGHYDKFKACEVETGIVKTILATGKWFK
ncbi:hypothetical protein AZE42_12675 [Rhizopogon vesiculosus]|uniref:Uncharacterized protein n=1 Tax=Rhizopogon vesiculosus TaxID=180088 RepID=A0A1J8QEP8_9AGAM|nr:hypothetical protein AZE42_12675 [Rhizopogon vesiculosus]